MTTKPTKQDRAQANQMLSREARLEDMETVAQLLADLRAARMTAGDERWIEPPTGSSSARVATRRRGPRE